MVIDVSTDHTIVSPLQWPFPLIIQLVSTSPMLIVSLIIVSLHPYSG